VQTIRDDLRKGRDSNGICAKKGRGLVAPLSSGWAFWGEGFPGLSMRGEGKEGEKLKEGEGEKGP